MIDTTDISPEAQRDRRIKTAIKLLVKSVLGAIILIVTIGVGAILLLSM